MKTKKYWILVVLLVVVCCIWTILYSQNVMSGEKAQIQAEQEEMIWVKCRKPSCGAEYHISKKEYFKYIEENADPMAPTAPPQVCEKCGEQSVYRAEKCPKCGVVFFRGAVPNDFADRCPECGFSATEDSRERGKRGKIHTGWGTMPGLRGSLVDLSCVGINIEDLSLDAVRYGLTKKNILKAVESQLHEENIKTFDADADLSGESKDVLNLRREIVLNSEPQLHVEVDFAALKGGLYIGFINVSMKQSWYHFSDEVMPKDLFEEFRKQGIRTLKKNIESTNTTTWERTSHLLGKLDDFAEDEKNSLEELVGQFINDYLAANPTKGKDAQAILDYSKAIEIDPRNAEAYLKRGLAYAKQYQRGDYFNEGVWDKAIADFSKVIEIEPRNVEVYFKRADLYRKKGQYSMAILDYSKVIEIDPRNAEAYYERGYVYDWKGKLGQAIADYTKVIEIDPRNAEACYRRGMAYYFKKEFDKSWRDVHRAQSLGYKVEPGFFEDLEYQREASIKLR